MIPFVVSGVVTGSIIAILALGLGLTHVASRIFNVGHGATAFFVAICFYYLKTGGNWPTWAAAVLSILVIAPALGLILWVGVFRALEDRSATVKLVATIGLYVALPAIALFAFGNRTILSPPGLAGVFPPVHDVLGVQLNDNQILAPIAAAVVAVGLWILLRHTRFGLTVRAVVDGPMISQFSGIKASRVSIAVWALGSIMAGLSGVLLAPLVGLNVTSFGLLLVSSFAAVVVARFSSLPVILFASLGIGIIQDLFVKWLPATGFFASATMQACVPFLVIFVVLVVYQVRGTEWGSLDRSTFVARSTNVHPASPRQSAMLQKTAYGTSIVLGVGGVAAVAAFLSGYWIGIVAAGMAMAVVLLSYTLVVGEGAMISLCQISFAGIGAATMGQLLSAYHWPFVVAVVASAVVAGGIAVPVALIVTRLGNLYFALATLAFSLLIDNLVFGYGRFYNFDSGVVIQIPAFLTSPTHLLFVFAAIVGVLLALLTWMQHSTLGLVLAGVRSSPPALEMIGANVARTRLIVFIVGAGVAGLGGAMLCTYTQLALPASQFPALTGLVWLAVLVTLGVRSPLAPLIAGMSLEVFPQLVQHLPTRYTELLPAFFGLGAVGLARDPRGAVQAQRDAVRGLILRFMGGSSIAKVATAATSTVSGNSEIEQLEVSTAAES